MVCSQNRVFDLTKENAHFSSLAILTNTQNPEKDLKGFQCISEMVLAPLAPQPVLRCSGCAPSTQPPPVEFGSESGRQEPRGLLHGALFMDVGSRTTHFSYSSSSLYVPDFKYIYAA